MIVRLGRPAAEAYALRERCFAGRIAALEQALISGALRRAMRGHE